MMAIFVWGQEHGEPCVDLRWTLASADIGIHSYNHSFAVNLQCGRLVSMRACDYQSFTRRARRGLLKVNRNDELLAFDVSFHDTFSYWFLNWLERFLTEITHTLPSRLTS